MKSKLFLISLILIFLVSANAQLSRVADETFSYIKASTFGKPAVAKKTEKLSIGQLRVHYKLITSRASVKNNNAADVTVYLDSDLTNVDLQNLTNEFYSILQQRLSAIGIGATDWKAIEATEYFQERQKSQEDKKPKDYDGKAGQAWVSFTAFDGPVLLNWRPYVGTEIIGYSQFKKLSKTAETSGGDFASIDVVVDFASIMLNTEIKQDKGFIFYGDPYFHSEYSIGGMISVPQSYIYMLDRKNGFDQYKNDLPVAERIAFAGKPYKDETKAALATQNFFKEQRSSFTPLVIPTKRESYLIAARKVLTLYAELLAEKMRVLRSGEKPSDNSAAKDTPKDSGKTLEQVTAEAKKNNEATPVTTKELTIAAKDAFKKGDYKLATQYLGELIKLNPDDKQNYLDRGAVYLNNLKDYKSAIKDFEQGMKVDPNEPVFYYNRGTAYTKLEDWKKAKKDFDKHISMNPNYAESYLNRGVANIYLKDYDAALADFNRGIQVNPRLANLYRGRAMVYKIKGNAAAAQADEITAARLGN